MPTQECSSQRSNLSGKRGLTHPCEPHQCLIFPYPHVSSFSVLLISPQTSWKHGGTEKTLLRSGHNSVCALSKPSVLGQSHPFYLSTGQSSIMLGAHCSLFFPLPGPTTPAVSSLSPSLPCLQAVPFIPSPPSIPQGTGLARVPSLPGEDSPVPLGSEQTPVPLRPA